MASRWNSRVSILLLFCFPELLLSAVVTLHSLEIYKTHEWIPARPTVYFHCKGENKTVLPDVKEKHTVYNFKGEESWQPPTEFLSRKCKRCGLYEEAHIMSDDVFDEWEFCPSDFTQPDGLYIRTRDNEFNATFLCQECIPLTKQDVANNYSAPHDDGNGMHWAIVVVIISAVGSTVLITGVVISYKYWQKRKRPQEQARFLKTV